MTALTSASLAPLARPLPRGPLVAFSLWGAMALAFSLSGLFSPDRFFFTPLSILGGTAAVLLSWWRLPAARGFFEQLAPRAYLAPHLIRILIGMGFLVQHSRGLLPGEFAVRAGVGDIIVGVLTGLALLIPDSAPWRRKALWAVNLLGLVDILIVVVTAQRILFFGDPASMGMFSEALWPMVPLFVVPLIISTHLLLFVRLRQPTPEA
jgi:hypothetical protein